MAVQTKVTISSNSSISKDSVTSFDAKIKKALINALGVNIDVFCDIIIDGELPNSIQKQLTKVGKNLFVGFSEGITHEESNRKAFLFECMAIKDSVIESSKIVVVIVSSSNFIDIYSKNPYRRTDENEDKSNPNFTATVPKYSLDKVILDDNTRGQINRSLALIRNQKLIFDTWGFREVDPNTKTILCFFGAPGTGKTMCAHAIAKELGKKIMIASYASIESKWVGEGPKNMRKIFDEAREQDAILFFDEADSFLSKRVNNAETGSDKHYNRMSNEMFQLLEDFDGVVIFATNLVTDFDKAFKSRILSFVEFSLPDAPTRAKLIQTMIPSKLPLDEPLSSNYLQPLANASEGFSGRDIRKAMLTALSEGALNEITSFGLDDLLIGFFAVNNERKAVKETASRERSVISDYLETSAQNGCIIEFCHWAIDQQEIASDSSKETLYKICRVLNSEMPDLSVSYKNKDLQSSAENIVDANRVSETLVYVAQILCRSSVDTKKSIETIEKASELLKSPTAIAVDYLESLQKIQTI